MTPAPLAWIRSVVDRLARRPARAGRAPGESRRRTAGVALVLVLSCLTLLCILVLAFLASVSTELDTSSSFAASADVKQRSQTAVSLVIGQIQEATSQSNISWSSQPGMIRTFDTTGQPAAQYKLYSSGKMVESAFNPLSGGKPSDVPADWSARPSEYTDLNQPVLAPNQDIGGIIPDATKPGEKFIAEYPILDPAAAGTVKGFSIDLDGDGTPDPAPDATYNPLAQGNLAPMPVQWLYMLKDGSLRTIDPSTKKLTGGAVDATNPPVARIAFWTDDDTCKVNINTAAGDQWDDYTSPGSFTDMPIANNAFESILRLNQPVQHEFQRYPGHPATTYLSAVFPNLTRAQIADIIPRISNFASATTTDVSSQGGTVPTNLVSASLPLSDGMPLYASVDELRYKRSTTARTKQDTVFSAQDIEHAKFFLTAQSRAPEINLFNKPRVSIWPEPAVITDRTAFDRSIAFCATVAGRPYYFVRNDACSPTADWANYQRNRDLYAYLQDMTATEIPGFGGSNFLAKYGPDRDQILTEIFDYIRCTNLVDATSAAPFAFKPTTTIKTANDLKNSDLRGAPSGLGHVIPIEIGTTRGFGRTNTLYCPILLIGALQTVVTNIGPTQAIAKTTGMAFDTSGDGFLRGKKTEYADKAVLKTKAIQALFLLDTFSPSQGPVRYIPDLVYKITGLEGLMVDGQSFGFPSTCTSNFNCYAFNHEYAWGGYASHAALFADRGISGFVTKPLGSGTLQYQMFSAIIPIDKEYKKGSLSISGGNNIFLEIYARDKAGTVSPTYIQRIALKFPPALVPVPAVPGSYLRTYNSAAAYGYDDDPTIPVAGKSRLKIVSDTAVVDSPGVVNLGYNAAAIGGQTMFDVSRSLVPSHGDMRLVSAVKDVPDTVFIKGRGYDALSDNDYSTCWRVNTGEENSGGMVGAGPRQGNTGNHMSTSGRLVANVAYDQHLWSPTYYPVHADTDAGPAVSSLIDGTQVVLTATDGSKKPGDWDNGMGGVIDGPYINKADEGEQGDGAYGGFGTTSSPKISLTSLFSPNRQAPSPIVFGSLSTGVKANPQKPWQTLLFCPNSPAKSIHPGTATPADHLLLDLFWMPVVEPYAISEPFSTAGKINLNYQIVPFTNITRSTGLQAVLRSTRLSAIPTGDGTKYKSGTPNPDPYRIPLDIDETLKGFERRFAANNIFKSASQICEMFLIPRGKGATIDTIANWWDDYKLTGDNLRERPYSQIYSRLTTKSNTYTVHVRVQSLLKSKGGAAQPNYDEWNEGIDKVTGEYRGSFGIERFLNPNVTAAQYDGTSPLLAYKFRTVSTKQFTP